MADMGLYLFGIGRTARADRKDLQIEIGFFTMSADSLNCRTH
jgi:hypothetical protein